MEEMLILQIQEEVQKKNTNLLAELSKVKNKSLNVKKPLLTFPQKLLDVGDLSAI